RVGNGASPGLDINGDGRGCNQVYGQFAIAHITADATSAITVLDATFTQQCQSPTAPALTGRIQYQAPVAAPVTESVSNSATVAGQPVTLAAVVSGQGTGTPTGTVTFSENGTVLGEVPVDSNGFAS